MLLISSSHEKQTAKKPSLGGGLYSRLRMTSIEGFSRRESFIRRRAVEFKFESKFELLHGRARGAVLRHSLGGSPNLTRRFRVGGSLCGPRPARLGCKFRAATSQLFLCEMKFSSSMELARSCCRPKPRASPRSIFRSFR